MSDQGDLRLGGYAAAVDARLARWQEEAFGGRLWEKDYRLWSPEPIPELSDRLGWLDLPNSMTAAVDTLSRLAREVAAEGIRVNGVRPGIIYSDIHADGGEPGRVDRLGPTLPMQRGGDPIEVARAILWLLSDEASYSTASFIDVAGGR